MIPQSSLLKRTVPVLIQCAGAHRKPIWLPVAKSKIFRIPRRPNISQEERLELRRITNNYKTQMRAVRRFFNDEMIKEKSTLESTTSEMSQRVEAEEWQRCVELNDKWNAQLAVEREERRKQQLAEMQEYALAHMVHQDKIQEEIIEKAAEEVRIQKELSATFITPETLDEAIEHALSNPIDYNFAIDLQGNQYVGRDTPITPPKDEQKISEASIN